MHWREFTAYILLAYEEAQETEEKESGQSMEAWYAEQQATGQGFGKPPPPSVLRHLPTIDP